MTLDFDVMFKPAILAAKMNRSHPSVPRDKKWIVQYSLVQIVAITGLILMLYSVGASVKINDFSSVCRNGCCGTLYFVNTLQYVLMVYYQDKLNKIIGNINSDYIKLRDSPEDEKIVTQYAEKGRTVCKQWVVITFLGFILFPVVNAFLYLWNYYKGNEFELLPILDMTYPQIIEENKNKLSVYAFLYWTVLLYALNSAVTYMAFVPLGPIFVLHAAAQLELTKNRIEKLFDKSSNNDINVELGHIIRHILYIYSFIDDVNQCFAIFYDSILKLDAIILAITTYEVIEGLKRGEFCIEFMAFIIGGVMICSTPCYYSDVLMEKGEEVRQAVYGCGWECHYDPASRRARTTLLIILIRATRPFAIRTMFRTLCLDALTDLFQLSYTIFNLMNAMWK